MIVSNESVMRDFYLKGYMTKDETLKLALEALERCVATCFDPYAHEQAMSWSEHFVNQTITAIKETLAQPEQEPVGEIVDAIEGAFKCSFTKMLPVGTKLYTTPPQCTKQEPVAWINPKELLVMKGNAYAGAKDWRVNLGLEPEEDDVPLYTEPQQRTWVEIDDEDFSKALELCDFDKIAAFEFFEDKLKEKNK